jgi:hypothetical protein
MMYNLAMAKLGRPSDYTPELAAKICSQLAEGKSLRSVCSAEDMPSTATVFTWFAKYPAFLEQYTHAKEESADAMAEEMLDIADDGSNDFMTITKGNHTYNVEDREVTNRSRLRVDTRKWIMSKMKPKKYGEKLDLTSGGEKLPTPIYGGLINTNVDNLKK